MAKISTNGQYLSNQATCSLDLDFSSHKMDSKKRLSIGLCKIPIFWANLLFAAVIVAAEVAQSVTLPLWLDSGNDAGEKAKIGSYFIMSFSSLALCVSFGLGTMYVKIYSPQDIGDAEKKFPHLLLFLTGLSDALNWIIVGYAGRGSRTPPYLQAILGNFLIPLTIIFRIIFLRKKPTILKVFCGIVVFIGLFVCFVPIIFPSCSSEANQEARAVVQVDEVSRLIWPIIFMLGSFPEAAMNVLQEHGLKMKNTSEEQINIVYYLFWTSVYELLGIALFLWIDILPWYGDSKNISNFATNWWTGLRCLVGQDGCGSAPAITGMIHVLAHVLGHLGAANLVRHAEGATWLAFVVSLVTPLGFLFWTLFCESPFKWLPEVHASTWFSIGALAIMVPAIFAYNLGAQEIPENRNGTKTQRQEIFLNGNCLIEGRNSSDDDCAEEPLLPDNERPINYNSISSEM